MCLKLVASSQIELSYICVEVDTLEFKRPRASRAVPARNDPLISSSAPDGHNASHATIVRQLAYRLWMGQASRTVPCRPGGNPILLYSQGCQAGSCAIPKRRG